MYYALKRARKNTKNNTFEMMRRWWEEKFHLPDTSDEFLNMSEFDLAVKFFEDFIVKYPDKYYELLESMGEPIYFTDTGDPLIDKWERQLRNGEMPDLTEGLQDLDMGSEEDLVRYVQRQDKAEQFIKRHGDELKKVGQVHEDKEYDDFQIEEGEEFFVLKNPLIKERLEKEKGKKNV